MRVLYHLLQGIQLTVAGYKKRRSIFSFRLENLYECLRYVQSLFTEYPMANTTDIIISFPDPSTRQN